jgi:hypothetical protein
MFRYNQKIIMKTKASKCLTVLIKHEIKMLYNTNYQFLFKTYFNFYEMRVVSPEDGDSMFLRNVSVYL